MISNNRTWSNINFYWAIQRTKISTESYKKCPYGTKTGIIRLIITNGPNADNYSIVYLTSSSEATKSKHELFTVAFHYDFCLYASKALRFDTYIYCTLAVYTINSLVLSLMNSTKGVSSKYSGRDMS